VITIIGRGVMLTHRAGLPQARDVKAHVLVQADKPLYI